MDYLKEKIVFAERALVYAIGFDFDVQHPHETAVKYIEHFRLENCVKFPPNASLPPESGVVWPKFNHFSYIVLTMLNDRFARCLMTGSHYLLIPTQAPFSNSFAMTLLLDG